MNGPGLVTFVGAGPGDPELLTLKGKKAIEEAALVLYAGSLVSPEIAAFAGKDAEVIDSAGLTLEECHALVAEASFAGLKTARVHTGDPSIYGAMAEQINLLDRDGIPWRVIPGVTAAMAAAAAAGVSFSIPEVSQSLIITRAAGRTPMPENENLAAFAASKTAMAIYLAGRKCEKVQEELEKVLPKDTPLICASRVGWPEERIIRTTLGDLARRGAENGLGRQTVILVLPAYGRKGGRSKLYDPAFSHEFRSSAGG